MQKDQVHNSDYNNIIFQGRNKEFGAYWIRKSYVKNLLIAFLISTTAFTSIITGPYLYDKFTTSVLNTGIPGNSKAVDFEMVEINIPAAELPAPPPPPKKETQPVQEEDLPPEPVVEESVVQEEEIEPDTVEVASTDPESNTRNEFNENNPFEENDSVPSGSGIAFNESYLENSQAAFPGGISKMDDYLLQNMRQPNEETGLTGTVVVGFTVMPDGNIENVKILKGLHVCPECEEDALRVIKDMPKWTPSISNGYPQKTEMKKSLPYNISDTF